MRIVVGSFDGELFAGGLFAAGLSAAGRFAIGEGLLLFSGLGVTGVAAGGV
jgi:hypothetical protein